MLRAILPTLITLIGCSLALAGWHRLYLSLPLITAIYLFIFFTTKSLTTTDWEQAAPRLRLVIILLCVVLVGVESRLIFLPHILNWDEGYYLNAASGYHSFGSFHTMMWRFPEPTSMVSGGGPGYMTLPYLWFLHFFGVNLTNARLFSYSFALVSLVLCFLFTKNKFGNQAAICATSLLSVSLPFVNLINARNDSYALAAFFTLLIIAEKFSCSKNPLTHLLLGLLCILTLEFHVNAAYLSIFIGINYLLTKYGERRRDIAMLVLGGVLGAGVFLYQHLFRYGDAFIVAATHCRHCMPNIFLREQTRIFDLFLTYPTEILLLIILAAYLFISGLIKEQIFKHYCLALLGSYLFFILVIPPHYEQHLIPLIFPLLGAILSRAIITTISSRAFSIPLLLTVLITIYLKTASITEAHLTHSGDTEIRESYAHCIAQTFPIDTVVAGPGPLFALIPQFKNYLTVTAFTEQAAKLQGITLLDLIKRESPKAIIILEQDMTTQNMVLANYANYNKSFIQISAGFYVYENLAAHVTNICKFTE